MRHFSAASLMLASLFLAASAFSSEGVDDVIKLQKGGVSVDIMTAFVETSKIDFNPSADEIQALQDAGVPATVIVAMLDHGKNTAAPVADNTAPAPAPAADTAAPAAPADTDTETAAYAPPADDANISTFYETLSPYGSWQQDPDAGYYFTPTVAATAEWQPYCNDGQWVYSDNGWYWQSSYPWGWAAFHYGRWGRFHDHWGWVPDNTWGPAWVSWRQAEGYYGWAPLPFGATFVAGGFDFRNRRVGVDFDFGLSDSAFTFVPVNLFLDVNLGRHALSRRESADVFRRAKLVPNTYAFSDNHVFNHGVAREDVALRTGKPIVAVHIADATVRAGQRIPRERFANNEIVAYRPALAAKATLDPQAAIKRQQEFVREHSGGVSSNAHVVTAPRINRVSDEEALRRVNEAKQHLRQNAPERIETKNNVESEAERGAKQRLVEEKARRTNDADVARKNEEIANRQRAENAKVLEQQNERKVEDAKRETNRVNERVVEHPVEHTPERTVERAPERAVDRTPERTVDRTPAGRDSKDSRDSGR